MFGQIGIDQRHRDIERLCLQGPLAQNPRLRINLPGRVLRGSQAFVSDLQNS